MSKIFNFDPAAHLEEFAAHGWVHVRGGIDTDFHEHLCAIARDTWGRGPLSGPGIAGAKTQFLFEPPLDVDLSGELFDMVSAMCGTRRETMTLSERHIKAYQEDADPDPAAHKDRLSSQIAVGLSVEIPAKSRLVLYPHDHREVNPFLTADHRGSLASHELPEVVLRDARPVEIEDTGGDVVVFEGSSTWHRRLRSGGAILLYLKCNDFDCDPLGEDPTTDVRRQATSMALRSSAASGLDALVPVLSRRFQSAAHEYGRAGMQRRVASVWGQSPFSISEAQLSLLRAIDGRRPWESVRQQLEGRENGPVETDLRNLAHRGAIDLLDG